MEKLNPRPSREEVTGRGPLDKETEKLLHEISESEKIARFLNNLELKEKEKLFHELSEKLLRELSENEVCELSEKLLHVSENELFFTIKEYVKQKLECKKIVELLEPLEMSLC